MDHLSDPVFLHVKNAVDYLRKQIEDGRADNGTYWVARKVELTCALAEANRTNHPEKGRVLRLMNWCRSAERSAERRAA